MSASVDFYSEAFGFEVSYRWPPDGTPRFAALRLGPHSIAVARRGAPEELIGRAAASRNAPPRFELCIYADDTDAAAELLRGLGARELRPPEDMPWGERMAYFEDPDGNPIQITAPLTHERTS